MRTTFLMRRMVLPLVVALFVVLGGGPAAAVPTAPAAGPTHAGDVSSPTAARTAPDRVALPAATPVVCTSTSHPDLAAALARDIQKARAGRTSTVAVGVDAPGVGLTCSLNGSAHFDSASIVKVIILGATLRKALDQHRYLTSTEVRRLRAMIMRSDNTAASAQWRKLGRPYIQRFLNRAGMRQTVLGPGRYWGLTQATAHDEIILLNVLMRANPVLSDRSRAYALGLMAKVAASQRWGVPAGAPRTATVHVKNGWLPRATHGWRINSIGGFTWPDHAYSIVVLSRDNGTMPYGIATVESLSRAIHRNLNPAVADVIPPSAPNQAWGKPDGSVAPTR